MRYRELRTLEKDEIKKKVFRMAGTQGESAKYFRRVVPSCVFTVRVHERRVVLKLAGAARGFSLVQKDAEEWGYLRV